MKQFFYRAQANEGVVSVCEKFGASIERTIKDNLLTKDLCEGDLVLVTVCDSVYIANAGETYGFIAKKLGIDEERLKEQNGLPYLFYGLPIDAS